MAADGEGQDHHRGREVPDLLDDFAADLVGVLQMGIGQARVPPLHDPEHCRGRALGLVAAQDCAAPRPALAGREIQYAGAVPGVARLQQRSGAGQLDVVSMGRDGKQVDGHAVPPLLVAERLHRVHP